ncbi:permease [Herbihabitans rhizosphaerae]|nr:permease [Herbihabitans rhizosphaerae]
MTSVAQKPQAPDQPPRRGFRITSLEVLSILLIVALLGREWLASLIAPDSGQFSATVRTASTVFVAVCAQALPFLVLGVLISASIAAFVPASALRKVLPKRSALAVPVAGAAGIALPGCECASVPVARRLMQRGVAPAVALTFLLAAPAVNPVVIVSTAVAFPNDPEMPLARFLGSLLTAVGMGWLWARFGKLEWIAERALKRLPEKQEGRRWLVFADTARGDLVEAGGFLVLGALVAAVLKVVVPASWMSALGSDVVLGVIVMAVLAVVLALCSEADAFVAAAAYSLPLLPKLVFLVVGPAVDVKLVAMQAGTFGRSFALRFAPLTFVVALLSAIGVGLLVFGGAG